MQYLENPTSKTQPQRHQNRVQIWLKTCVFFVGKAGILGSGAGMRDWDKFVPWLGSSASMEILTRFIVKALRPVPPIRIEYTEIKTIHK